MVYLSQLITHHYYTIFNKNPYFNQTHALLLMPLFSCSIWSGKSHYIQLSSFSEILQTVTVSLTFLVLDDFDSFEEDYSDFVYKNPPLGSDILLKIIRWGLWVIGRKTTEIKYHLYHITSVGTYSQCDLSLLTLILATWLRYYLSEFSLANLLFSLIP